MVLEKFTHPYSSIEAFLYDFFIASAVTSFSDHVRSIFIDSIPEKALVLDVGCGGGHNALNLLQVRHDVQLDGLDLSKDQVERARKRTLGYSSRSAFVQASAENLPFAAESYDVVYSIASIKHWPNPAQGLAECYRVLRSGGFMLVIEADRGCLLPDTKTFIDRWRVPFFLKPLCLIFFRTYVAGQSLDVEEARTLLMRHEFSVSEVTRIPDLPAFSMYGKKK